MNLLKNITIFGINELGEYACLGLNSNNEVCLKYLSDSDIVFANNFYRICSNGMELTLQEGNDVLKSTIVNILNSMKDDMPVIDSAMEMSYSELSFDDSTSSTYLVSFKYTGYLWKDLKELKESYAARGLNLDYGLLFSKSEDDSLILEVETE